MHRVISGYVSFWLLAAAPMFPAPGYFLRRHAKPRPNGAEISQPGGAKAPGTTDAANWQSPAVLRHGLAKTRGKLEVDSRGIEFQPEKGAPLRWPYLEISAFSLTPHRLILSGYENRRWHMPGDRSFRFDLETSVPPAVASELAQNVGKPVENGNPDPGAAAFATLAARHRTRGGGTNGVLRFRRGGIDYVTADGRGARSWNWSDIQTIASPDPYHFRVGGYREVFEFELKQPMSRQLFDQLWDEVYGRGLSLRGGTRP